MSDDTNHCAETDTSTEGRDDSEWTRKQWLNLASNPTQQQLGYDVAEWNAFETGESADEVLFLPDTESQLKDAAFVVSGEDGLVDLKTRC